jgi:hypothetical protein
MAAGRGWQAGNRQFGDAGKRFESTGMLNSVGRGDVMRPSSNEFPVTQPADLLGQAGPENQTLFRHSG